MKYAFLIAFLALAIVQWLVPGKMIWEKGQVLAKGEAFKFKTEPVDPSNPFKGKYITLNFAENSFTTDTAYFDIEQNEPVYVLLGTDRYGYAVVRGLTLEKPSNTNSFVKANVWYTSKENDSVTVHIDYPFDEFYMDEYKAPRAEEVYRESTVDSSRVTYALVRILKGDAVLENVFIDEKPIGSY